MTSRRAEIQQVLLITLVANLLVAAAKIIVGVLSSSLAMIADGIHSSLDGLSNVIGLVSNYLAGRPPDAEHPYGHRRFETLASMMIGGILLLTGWEIIQSSIGRLGTREAPDITPLNFVAMIVTVLVNLSVTAYESLAGKRLQSEFLLADAAHTRSDVLVSLTVLASLVGVWLGWYWIDAAAAIGVVGLIAVVAYRIVRSSADILVDRAALDAETVTEIAEGVAGVQGVARVRSRGPSDEVYLDVDLKVAGPTTAAHSDAIAQEVRKRLNDRFTGLVDIQVNFLPDRDAPPDLNLLVRAAADAFGLGVHEIIPTPRGDELALEMHVEVQPDLSVGQAHDLVTQFEHRLKDEILHLSRVVTHIEPAPVPNDSLKPDGKAGMLEAQALQIAQRLYPQNWWHDLAVSLEPDGGYALSMHCHVPAEMSIEDAHNMAERVETQVRAEIPQLHRLTIHTEPHDAP